MNDDPNDIFVWPCGSRCFREEFEHDDPHGELESLGPFEVIRVATSEWDYHRSEMV